MSPAQNDLAERPTVAVWDKDNPHLWLDWGSQATTNDTSWAHPGLAVLSSGLIVVGDPTGRSLWIFRPDGDHIRTVPVQGIEVHGITTDRDLANTVWLADPGFKVVVSGDSWAHEPDERGRVVRLDLERDITWEVPEPPRTAIHDGPYRPTSVAVAEDRLGGDRSIWIADGYGLGGVHHFAANGDYLRTLTGEESGEPFATPHAVFVDNRGAEPELYVADREHRLIRVYDLDGHAKRAFGADFTSSPSGFAAFGPYLVVAELRARLLILDDQDRLVREVGANEAACDVDGWPNERASDGSLGRPRSTPAGRFQAPHSVAVDDGGSLYVAEFVMGGRYSKLCAPGDVGLGGA